MITQGLNYTSTSYQNDYLTPYSSYNSYNVYPTIKYSNNFENYNPLLGVNTNPTNFYASNNYNTYKAITISYYPNNNMSNNNFIQTSYQPSYINITYSNNVNANLAFNNNNFNNSTNSTYASTINPQNSFINKIEPPKQNLIGYDPNLVSNLKHSYFNERILPYSVATYEPILPANKNNILGDYINSNFDLIRYITSSVPVKENSQNKPEIDNEIIPIKEEELFPNKDKNSLETKTIQFHKRNISIITPQITHNYYIPKNLPSYNPSTRNPSKISKKDNSSAILTLNSVSTYKGNEQFNSNDIFGIDFPYDNNKIGVYSKGIYSINLCKKKKKKKSSLN